MLGGRPDNLAVWVAISVVGSLVLGYLLALLVFRKLGPRILALGGVLLAVPIFGLLVLPFPFGLLAFPVLLIGGLVLLNGAVMSRALAFRWQPLTPAEADPELGPVVPDLGRLGFHLVGAVRFVPPGLPATDVLVLLNEEWRTVAQLHVIAGSGQLRLSLESDFGDRRLVTTSSTARHPPSSVVWSLPEATPDRLYGAHTQVLRWLAELGLQPAPVGAEAAVRRYQGWEEADAAYLRALNPLQLALWGFGSAPRQAPWDQPDTVARLGGGVGPG